MQTPYLGSQACVVCMPDLQENSVYSFNRSTLFPLSFCTARFLSEILTMSLTHSLLGPSWQDWILFEVQSQHNNDGVSFQPDFLEPFHWTLLSSHPNLLCITCLPNSIYHYWIIVITFNFLHLFFASFLEKQGRREIAETRAKKPGHKVVTQQIFDKKIKERKVTTQKYWESLQSTFSSLRKIYEVQGARLS